MIEFQENAPIYIQILDTIKMKILSGEYTCGMKMSTVRDLAVQFRVNPNTMQRALNELEREGLCYTERTSGRYITNDEQVIKKMRTDKAKNVLQSFVKDMTILGLNKTEILKLIDEEEL